jgi:hypothetical protein
MTDRNTLTRETNARFWALTGYKPGRNLDMTNPNDLKMVKVWFDIYRRVRAEDAAGHLVLTHETTWRSITAR